MVLPTGGGEATNPENMEALYASVRSWGTEEEGDIAFQSWKVVYEYQDPVDPTSLSANFGAVFMEVASLPNFRVERTVILNDITQDNNKVVGDERNDTVKFHRLERSTEEAVSKFQSMVEEEQQNGAPQQKRPLEENEKPPAGQTRNMGYIKPSRYVK